MTSNFKWPPTVAGSRYGKLVAVKRTQKRPQRWLFTCDCGAKVDVLLHSVRGGRTQSCGCLHRFLVSTHGLSKTAEFRVWGLMLSRCTNSNVPSYDRYGGRGIMVCKRWRVGDGNRNGFECFYSDMGPRPSAKHSIERVKNNRGYAPQNCVWATDKVQANNMRRNIIVRQRGRSMTLGQACELVDQPYRRVWMRIYVSGWSIADALALARYKRP